MTTATGIDQELEAAQAALLARYAPDTSVRRLAWSEGETQVLECGSGPPLLLVHGGGDGAFEWIPILPALARNHRAMAIDRPGHGLADPYDYRGVDLLAHARTFLGDVLDALEVRTADVVANSLGGLWSVALALDAPDRVSRLALVGAPPGVERSVPYQLRMFGLPLVGRRLGSLVLSNPTRDSSRTFWGQVLVAHPDRLDDTLLDADVAHMRRNRDSIVDLMRSAVGAGGLRRRLILGDSWLELAVPTVLLYGERDVFMRPATRGAWEAIAAKNPHVRIVRIPGAGHLPWFDAPDRVVDEIERFLSVPSLEPRRTS